MHSSLPFSPSLRCGRIFRRMGLVVLLLASLPGASTLAAPPGTRVAKVFGRASAAPETILLPGSSFSTGASSKSELASDRGVVRMGEQAALETLPHGIALRQGVTLVASEPGRFRKTIEVRAPGYRLQVKGTVQVAFDPGRSLKVVALEGSVTVALDSVMGEFENLAPGQMLVINPSDHRLPEPVDIDIQRLTATSALVAGPFGALATASRIKAVAAVQALGYQRGTLTDTSLLLRGLDNALEIDRARLVAEPAAARRPLDAATVEQTLFNAIDDLGNPRAVVHTRPYQFPNNTGKTGNLGSGVLTRDVKHESRTQILTVELTQQKDRVPGKPPKVSGPPTISGNVTASPDFFAGSPRILRFLEIDPDPKFARLQIAPTAVVTSPPGVALEFDVNHGLDVNGGQVLAGTDGKTDPNARLFLTSEAAGITVQSDSILKGSTIAVEGGTAGGEILVDHSHLTSKGETRVGSRTLPTGLVIRNSSDLQSLAGGLALLTDRAAINIESKSTLNAKKDLLIDAYLRQKKDKSGHVITTPGVVSLLDATLTATNIRVRGYRAGGDALIIDGGTLHANQLLKLYAEEVATLRFRNHVSLSGKQVILAGRVIEVAPGGDVIITGKGRLFADEERYGSGGYGSLRATEGLTHASFARRDRFEK